MIMDDGELYLDMEGFRKKAPPPIPRLENQRRHSEVTWNNRSNDFSSVLAASLQDCNLTKPGRPNNYPRVNLRNDSPLIGPNQHDPPPPPRPAKPNFAADQGSRLPSRLPNDDPPPRPFKPSSYDDDFITNHPRSNFTSHSRPPLPTHGPPIDDRPLHAAPAPPRVFPNNHPPPVMPRQDVEEGSELYLMIDNDSGVQAVDMDEFSPPHPSNHGRDSYDAGRTQPKQFQLPPPQQPLGRPVFPIITNKPFGEHAGHVDHFGQPESKPRNMPKMEPRSVSPNPPNINNRSPLPSPLGHPLRRDSGRSSGKSFTGAELPQRHGSAMSQGGHGSDVPQRQGSSHSQGSYNYPEIPNRNGSTHSQTSTSSSDNLDEDRTGHDYQPRKMFQEIKKSFDDTPFRPPPPIPSGGKGLPPMTSAPPSEKPLPKMRVPSSPVSALSPRHQPTIESGSPAKGKNADEQPWYKNVTRQNAVQEIEQVMGDGCFIVRPGKGTNKPYSLTVCSDSTIYNLHIRRREDGNFALGLPKENERSFPNVVDLIEYYMETSLILAGNKGSVVLSGPP